MTISQNLLYLLLLYCVLDKDRFSTTTALLLALGIMLFGYCCNCNRNSCQSNRGFASINGI